MSFSMFVRTLPISFHVFAYDRSFTRSHRRLRSQLRRNVVDFAPDHLETFQAFDRVVTYYHGGQEVVTCALRGVFD